MEEWDGNLSTLKLMEILVVSHHYPFTKTGRVSGYGTISYACFMLCGDKLTTAQGLHAACSVLVCHVRFVLAYCSHVAATNLYIHIPQDFWEKNNSSTQAHIMLIAFHMNTTRVMVLYQTLPLGLKGWHRKTRRYCLYIWNIVHVYISLMSAIKGFPHSIISIV